MNASLSVFPSNKIDGCCLAMRKKMKVAQHFAWLHAENIVRTHTKAYIEFLCQNKYLSQSEAKVLCELVIYTILKEMLSMNKSVCS